jgi:hypothetical protein
MTDTRQFAACTYKPGQRPYTFHYDGPTLREGDRVRVAARKGDGWQVVTVEKVTDVVPPFDTKPILGMAEEAPPEAAAPAADLFGGDACPRT